VLGVILTMSASSADLATGTALLAVYSLGLGVPFLLAALFTDLLLERLKLLGRTGRRLQQAAGMALALVGILILTGRLEAMAYWLLESFPVLARIG
jgi:cytochrome c-type biogenesis protein